MKPRSHHSRHVLLTYPLTLGERLYTIFLWPFFGVVVLALCLKFFSLLPSQTGNVHVADIIRATFYTLSRLLIAYVCALVFAIPLALLATRNAIYEKIFLPMFDVLESVPVLAFFPVLILFFIHLHFATGAAIFILFLSMLWNIVFTVAGGLKMIPKDITYAASVFGIRGFTYFRQIILPSIFPEIVTGSILGFAQGWNLVIVAEVLHTYIPGGTHADDLFGIGSILVHASESSQTGLFVASISAMIIVIALFNYFVWQKLIHYAERFKFE